MNHQVFERRLRSRAILGARFFERFKYFVDGCVAGGMLSHVPCLILGNKQNLGNTSLWEADSGALGEKSPSLPGIALSGDSRLSNKNSFSQPNPPTGNRVCDISLFSFFPLLISFSAMSFLPAYGWPKRFEILKSSV